MNSSTHNLAMDQVEFSHFSMDELILSLADVPFGQSSSTSSNVDLEGFLGDASLGELFNEPVPSEDAGLLRQRVDARLSELRQSLQLAEDTEKKGALAFALELAEEALAKGWDDLGPMENIQLTLWLEITSPLAV